MFRQKGFGICGLGIVVVAIFVVVSAYRASAHCDALDGPVITEARAALEKGDVTGLLKWVRKEDEKEIRTVFAASLAVRAKGKEARELAEAVLVRDISACSSCGRRGKGV